MNDKSTIFHCVNLPPFSFLVLLNYLKMTIVLFHSFKFVDCLILVNYTQVIIFFAFVSINLHRMVQVTLMISECNEWGFFHEIFQFSLDFLVFHYRFYF